MMTQCYKRSDPVYRRRVARRKAMTATIKEMPEAAIGFTLFAVMFALIPAMIWMLK